MKTGGISLLFMILLWVGCQKKEDKGKEVIPAITAEIFDDYELFGDSINSKGVITSTEMLDLYTEMQPGDTIDVKFKSTIEEVCQKKGCWMNVKLGHEKSSFVRFRDYAFFVPMNADEHEVVIDGKAFVSIVTVEELKHYAKDAGKSQKEIDKITEPRTTYAFLANGVMIEK